MRHDGAEAGRVNQHRFPFLFGGTFIEAGLGSHSAEDFGTEFPFLFGGTFIEALDNSTPAWKDPRFPFLFGGTFIEAPIPLLPCARQDGISLPFRRDFH